MHYKDSMVINNQIITIQVKQSRFHQKGGRFAIVKAYKAKTNFDTWQ